MASSAGSVSDEGTKATAADALNSSASIGLRRRPWYEQTSCSKARHEEFKVPDAKRNPRALTSGIGAQYSQIGRAKQRLDHPIRVSAPSASITWASRPPRAFCVPGAQGWVPAL